VTFTLADQTAFAALSGDWNPLHVDPVAARRTLMGAPVVHGVHLVLWAIERVLAAHPGEAVSIAAIRAVFRKPAYLDREVTLRAKLEPDGAHRIDMISSDGNLLELTVRFGAATTRTPVESRAWPTPVMPDELSRGAAVTARGQLPLAVDVALARARFPVAVARLGAMQLAELLATTRLVGMHCPGLYSLYAGLSLEAHVPTVDPQLEFEVAEAKLKYSVIGLRVTGPSLAGTLDTFYRPQSSRLEMDEVLRSVAPDAFAGQTALVVGGSRGLGEAFAKAIAAGGGNVCLTYHRGADDAARVVGEIRAANRRATAIALDVCAPASTLSECWPFSEPPTHVYYLATPPIRKTLAFRPEELELMIRYYVTGLHAVSAAAVELGAKQLVVWSPSTTMLAPPRGGTVYCIAKAAMEELGHHLPSLLPVTIHMPRIGRVDTDQTAGLIELRSAARLAVALEHLHLLSARPSLP